MLRMTLIFAGLAVASGLLLPHIIKGDATLPGGTGTRSSSVQASVASAISPSAASQVTLRADAGGHYHADVSVDGRVMPMMVDTGATVITLKYEDARDIGAIVPGDRFDIPVSTANGTAYAKRVQLRSVRIGGISLNNVDALVAPQGALGHNLLGMSFISRLRRYESQSGRLILEQ